MRETTFLVIVLQNEGFTFGGRDEVEDPLDEALQEAGLGEVTGGGAGLSSSKIDVEVTNLEEGLKLIRNILRDLAVAKSTVINQYEPERRIYRVYQEE